MIEKEKMENTPVQYVEIDWNALCHCLADDTWKEATNNQKADDLYELVTYPVQGSDEKEVIRIERQIKPEWATQYFLIYESFKELVLSFAKDK